MDYAKESLRLHYARRGKLEMTPRAEVDSKEALSLAYTPGVAQPCLEIQKDVNKSYELTRRWNTVAVVTDGSAVLGLGDIGPEAGMPVMEGKCVLFKAFGGVDAIPLCVRSHDVDDIVNTVALLAGSFGGVNLEDIAAPRCFEIERKLKERCDIPIFHDDQHGTAIITLAGLTNALRVVGKKLEEVRIVINGAGAAAVSITRLLLSAGAKDVTLCDRRGAIFAGRSEGMNWIKEEMAQVTNPAKRAGSLADLLVGARRMLEAVDTSGKDVLSEYRSDVIVDYLDSHPEYGRIAVLLSGDIGFYSGAKGLLSKLDRSKYEVETEAGISSAVYLCSKIGETWQDAYLTSAHGRESNIVGLVNTRPKVFTLLSGEDTVHAMCRQLFDYGLNDVTVTVGQDFGYPTERIFSGTPSECLDNSFGDLCVALIVNRNPDTRNPVGIPDEEFTRGDAPMTKSEVRALSVAKLKLSPDSVVYDVGAGTGSVSVEMALTAYEGKVYAIEREDVAADLIEINKRKFKASNIEVVRGLAPDAMEGLSAPTHAFIGGSAGNLKEIVQCLLGKNPDVRIAINSVTVETMSETLQVIKDLGLVEEELVNVTVARSRRLGRYHLMTGQNPVYIAVVRGR